MIKKFYPQIYFLLFFIYFPIILHAQINGTLRGTVTDSSNGESLSSANVYIRELSSGASTDNRGFFIIPNIPANNSYSLVVSYLGYQSKELQFIVAPNKITHIDIQLSSEGVELGTVEKIGERINRETQTDISLQRLSIKDLELMPKGVETDVFRSLQYLPGVQSTGDVSARYYVRGGSSNQNLVSIDGATIYNPFHALGLFSSVDPEIINSAEFYKGGFTAEYFGRISSVLNIITKDGNKNKYSGKASISQLSAKALIEGPIPYGSFIFTGRKSYSNEILKKFLNDKTAPVDFFDMSFKLNYSNPDFLPISKFTFQGLFTGDYISNNDPLKEDFEWTNSIVGFKWFQAADSPLFYELNLVWSNFSGKVIPNESTAKLKDNELNDISLRMDFTYTFDQKDELEFGINITDIKSNLKLENLFGAISDIGSAGTNFSIYSKYKLFRFEKLGIDIGSRINLTNLSKSSESSANMFEPRVNVIYNILPSLKLKGSWGIYRQELTTLSDETEIISLFEPWAITPEYLSPARATQNILGLEYNLNENITLHLETYYNYTRNISVINRNKFSSLDPDLISGDAEASGIEFLLDINIKPFSFTGSYSYSHAYKIVEGWTYYPRYDVRHATNMNLEVDLGSGWTSSLVWIFNSSLPFTQSIGYYDKFNFGDLYNDWYIFESYFPYALLSDLNLGRLPNYHRMDINISKKMNFSFMNIYLDFSIINIYNRKNLYYFKRDTGERVNMLPILPTASLKVEL